MGPGQAQGSETTETAQTAEGSETTESAQTVQGSEPAEPDLAEQGAPEGRPMEMMQPVGTTQEAGTESADGEETVFELSLLEINDGTIHVNAGGDGLDSNGDLIINGGTITVDGPENGGNGALDSGTESGGRLLVNGGTIAAAGSSGMAESFDEASEQASFHCTFSSSFAAGDVLTVTDAEGEEIFSMTMEKSGNDLVFSSPELTAGETVTVTVGELSMEAVCA